MQTISRSNDDLNTSRKLWIDYLRAISIVLVVTTHAISYAKSNYGIFLSRGGTLVPW